MIDSEIRYRTIVEKLREGGHKMTPQRLAVVKVLAGSEAHPSVEQIYEQVRGDFPTMSLATVYRNVMLVKSLGEVLELGFPDGSNRYDGMKPYPHPHVICTRCKTILDPDPGRVKDLSDRIATETGFQIHTQRMDFFGICPECQKKA